MHLFSLNHTMCSSNGQGGGLRPRDLLLPEQARYQTALHPVRMWVQSGRKDLNPRPLVTETSALPDCATPRLNPHRLLWPPAADGSYPDTDYYPCQTLFLRTYGAPATRRV